MHAYDALRWLLQAWMGCATQMLGVARLVGVQRTVQNNGNVKSEPKCLACEESPIHELLFFCRSLGFYSGLTSMLFFLRVTTRWLCSALIYALVCEYVCCKGPAAQKRHADIVV